MEALEDTWRNLQKIISERDSELLKEAQRQEDNDRLRKEFARHANAFHQWLTETRWLYFYIFVTGIIIFLYVNIFYISVNLCKVINFYFNDRFRLRLLGWDGWIIIDISASIHLHTD